MLNILLKSLVDNSFKLSVVCSILIFIISVMNIGTVDSIHR